MYLALIHAFKYKAYYEHNLCLSPLSSPSIIQTGGRDADGFVRFHSLAAETGVAVCVCTRASASFSNKGAELPSQFGIVT